MARRHITGVAKRTVMGLWGAAIQYCDLVPGLHQIIGTAQPIDAAADNHHFFCAAFVCLAHAQINLYFRLPLFLAYYLVYQQVFQMRNFVMSDETLKKKAYAIIQNKLL